MAKMSGSANHSIKQVALAEEEVNRCDQEDPFLLQVEMEELAEEVQIHETAKELTGKPSMGVETRLACLLEAPGGKKLLKMKLRKRLLMRTKQTWTS